MDLFLGDRKLKLHANLLEAPLKSYLAESVS